MQYVIKEMETQSGENRLWYVEDERGDAVATMFDSPHQAEAWIKEEEEGAKQ